MRGSSPSWVRVDDIFRSDHILAAKIHRREPAADGNGEWGPARIKLDHVYTADGDSSVFDREYVVHASGIEYAERAEEYELKTMPPNTPNEEATRKLVSRDQLLREKVIPTLEQELVTVEGALEHLQERQMEQPMVELSEIGDLIESIQVTRGRVRRQRQHTTNGSIPPQPRMDNGEGALEDLDEDIEEVLEEMDDE